MKKLNLYMIYQEVNNRYDTYDSAIVCAATEDEAKLIHPNEDEHSWDNESYSYSWCKVEDVKVKLIGTAVKGSTKGVVLASYNAG